MLWIIYNILFGIGYLAMLPKFLLRMRKRGGYAAHFRERFGKYDPQTARRLSEKQRVWIHAVSVGEANLAGQIIKAMRSADPAFSCILSTTSSTGRAVCEKIVSPEDVLVYLPVDFPIYVQRMMNTASIKAFVITETELWPNLIRALDKRGIPIILVNGRISDHSAPGYRRMRIFFGPILRSFSKLLVQSELDKSRMIASGASEANIEITGSIKFDIAPPPREKLDHALETLSKGKISRSDHLVILGGSTWEGEEIALAEAWQAAIEHNPSTRLVLVPRHFERAPKVVQELAKHGFNCIRSSQHEIDSAAIPASSALPPILVVDTTGELFALYAVADIVFVGKSLPPNIGGQNMIEPALFGKAVICGPNTSNFVPVMETFRRGGAILEVADPARLRESVAELVRNNELRASLGGKARTCVDSGRGALARTVNAIRDIVGY